MNAVLMRQATPYLTALFLVSAVSGIALFFHLQPGWFHGVHEWLSLLLLVPFVVHALRNWKPLLGYVQRGQMLWPSVIAAVVALAFIVPAAVQGTSRPDPLAPLAAIAGKQTLGNTAAYLGVTGDVLRTKLVAEGYAVHQEGDRLADIAAGSGKTTRDLVLAILADVASLPQ